MEVQRRFREAVQHRAEVIVQVQGRCKVQGAEVLQRSGVSSDIIGKQEKDNQQLVACQQY